MRYLILLALFASACVVVPAQDYDEEEHIEIWLPPNQYEKSVEHDEVIGLRI